MRSKVIALFTIVGLLAFAQMSSAQEKKEKKKRPGTFGTVKSVDKSANTITVTTGRKGETSDRTLKLSKDVKVTIGGESKTLDDVKAGDRVILTVVNEEVTEIRSGFKKKKDNA